MTAQNSEYSKAGTQQIGDSHPNALTYGIDLHRPESVSHFAMRITLFSSLVCVVEGAPRQRYSGRPTGPHRRSPRKHICPSWSGKEVVRPTPNNFRCETGLRPRSCTVLRSY